MDNLQESLTTIKKLFDTLSQDYKKSEDIFDDLKTWYGFHGCPYDKPDCNENDRIHLIDVNQGMLGMLTSVVSDLFIKDSFKFFFHLFKKLVTLLFLIMKLGQG